MVVQSHRCYNVIVLGSLIPTGKLATSACYDKQQMGVFICNCFCARLIRRLIAVK